MTTTETAKLLRKELKMMFPKQKFSVRKRSVGAIDVSWTDGLSQEKVKPILQKHEWYQRDHATGDILRGGNTFVFDERRVSDANRKKVEKKLKEKFGSPKGFQEERWLQQKIWEKLNKTTF